jgi:hypothetical protein
MLELNKAEVLTIEKAMSHAVTCLEHQKDTFGPMNSFIAAVCI